MPLHISPFSKQGDRKENATLTSRGVLAQSPMGRDPIFSVDLLLARFRKLI